jgi:hypothetical protein
MEQNYQMILTEIMKQLSQIARSLHALELVAHEQHPDVFTKEAQRLAAQRQRP